MALPESFKQIPLLTAQECQQVRGAIESLKPHWRKRITQYPFYTLGTASYIDILFGKETMMQRAAEDNPHLLENFQWLYDKLLIALHEILNGPVLLDPEFALPGLHIFLAHQAFTQPLASIHFDLQYGHYDWSTRYKWVDRSHPMSMTLPIVLPSGGGGLRIWDMTYERSQALGTTAFQEYTKSAPFTYHAYESGVLVVHSGHYLHQIAPLKDLKAGDERITLQAHAARTEQGWVVYW